MSTLLESIFYTEPKCLPVHDTENVLSLPEKINPLLPEFVHQQGREGTDRCILEVRPPKETMWNPGDLRQNEGLNPSQDWGDGQQSTRIC